MFAELREQLACEAIRKHQLGTKDLLTPTSLYNAAFLFVNIFVVLFGRPTSN